MYKINKCAASLIEYYILFQYLPVINKIKNEIFILLI